MKRLVLVMAVWLLPVSANAQLRLDFDADAYSEPAAMAANTEQSIASETDVDTARVVRRDGRTVKLPRRAQAAEADRGDRARVANAGS